MKNDVLYFQDIAIFNYSNNEKMRKIKNLFKKIFSFLAKDTKEHERQSTSIEP